MYHDHGGTLALHAGRVYMKEAQKPDRVDLNQLVNWLREGRFVIPNFQREFEWEPWDILELMRSIFLDYYIGSLLLWKGKAETFTALACEPIYGFTAPGTPDFIVLDGQQRLTAIYYAFFAPDLAAPKRKNRFLYYINVDAFMNEDYDNAFEYDWTQRGINLLAQRDKQFESHMFPIEVIGRGRWELPNWLQDYERYWTDRHCIATEGDDAGVVRQTCRHVENARRFGDHIKAITDGYQIAYIELDCDLALDRVCDIFTKINSRGIRLDVFDIVNALLTPKGLQLKLLWREAATALDFVETERMNVYILQVMSILVQGYCSPKYLYYLLPGQPKTVRDRDGSLQTEILIKSTDEFTRRWKEAVDALVAAINLLQHPQEYGAISSRFVPYVSILPAFAALLASAQKLESSRQLAAQQKIRLWYWASVFTNRYSGAVESTTARDYSDVRAWFTNDAAEPSSIAEFRSRFSALDLRRETKRGTSVYNGVFNLFVIRGARDWLTGAFPQYGDLDDHHIVPKSWSNKVRLDTSIDTILNRTPLTANTNRALIAERLPNEYIPELIRDNGEETVRRILESHFISVAALEILLRDPFTPAHYEEFISERQKTILTGMEELLVKGQIDLSPERQALDRRIEEIEIGVRCLIVNTLAGNTESLPPHIREKLLQRYTAVVMKDPTLVRTKDSGLDHLIEYADLRDLQDLLLYKDLWPKFERMFGSKDMLTRRFDQVAELRNSIRHTRTAGEVTVKEGDAALAWFASILSAS